MGTGTGSIDLSTLNNLHTNLTQHFWFNSNAGAAYGTGVHMTLSSQAEFIANPTGQNILMNTDGISIRNGVTPLMVLDDNSLDFNVVADAEQGTYNNIATFGVVTRIGGNSEYSAVIEAGRFGIESGSGTILFNISPSGNPTSDIHAISETTPMGSKLSYVLQSTPSNGTIIKCTYSYDARTGVGVPIGSGTMNFTAGTSSTQSKTERGTTVTITYTSPQTFSISASYSIGNLGMNAFSYYILDESVDLGILTFGSRQDGSTIGNNSATLGSNLIASHNYQTVVGKYNYDYDGAFVVGRGDSATRSNGLAIDWDGNARVLKDVYVHCGDDSSLGTKLRAYQYKKEDITSWVLPTTGVKVAAWRTEYGPITTVTIQFKTSGTVASGGNAFVAMMDSNPTYLVCGCGFYGRVPLIASLNQSGTLTVRNASDTSLTVTGSSTALVSLTYFTNDIAYA